MAAAEHAAVSSATGTVCATIGWDGVEYSRREAGGDKWTKSKYLKELQLVLRPQPDGLFALTEFKVHDRGEVYEQGKVSDMVCREKEPSQKHDKEEWRSLFFTPKDKKQRPFILALRSEADMEAASALLLAPGKQHKRFSGTWGRGKMAGSIEPRDGTVIEWEVVRDRHQRVTPSGGGGGGGGGGPRHHGAAAADPSADVSRGKKRQSSTAATTTKRTAGSSRTYATKRPRYEPSRKVDARGGGEEEEEEERDSASSDTRTLSEKVDAIKWALEMGKEHKDKKSVIERGYAILGKKPKFGAGLPTQADELLRDLGC